MVQKAVQQLLFDVDWRQRTGQTMSSDDPGGLDLLVIDMPPGTGDVQLTLGQLVNVDGEEEPTAFESLMSSCLPMIISQVR